MMLCVDFCGVEVYSKDAGTTMLVESSMSSFDTSELVRVISSIVLNWAGVVTV